MDYQQQIAWGNTRTSIRSIKLAAFDVKAKLEPREPSSSPIFFFFFLLLYASANPFKEDMTIAQSTRATNENLAKIGTSVGLCAQSYERSNLHSLLRLRGIRSIENTISFPLPRRMARRSCCDLATMEQIDKISSTQKNATKHAKLKHG